MDCPYCTYLVPDELDQCPHCARPAFFPNVRQVEQQHEIDAVARRYQQAVAAAAGRGCGAVGQSFEAKASTAQAVIGRPIEEALRLANSDNQGYATFYALLHAGVRLPNGDRWDRLREIADIELFGHFRDRVRFAALSVDGVWLRHYGVVALELKEPMISHRATVFEENSAVFFERARKQGAEPPVIAGYRARWCDRGKLAMAKHGADLTPTCTGADFSGMLLCSGATSADDVFIEVHVYGSFTRNCLSRVIIDAARASKAMDADLRDRLATLPIQIEDR